MDVVRARRFEVVDEQERVRAAIGSGPDGRTGIQVYGTDGEVRAELSVLGGEGGENSTLLSLRDKSGQDKAIIGVGEGIPAIGLYHSGEQPEESWGVSLLGEDPDDPKVSALFADAVSRRETPSNAHAPRRRQLPPCLDERR